MNRNPRQQQHAMSSDAAAAAAVSSSRRHSCKLLPLSPTALTKALVALTVLSWVYMHSSALHYGSSSGDSASSGGLRFAAPTRITHDPERVPHFALASVFGPSMVLQRNAPIRIWGWGAPGLVVRVSLGSARAVRAIVGPDGQWIVSLPPLPASGPMELSAMPEASTRVHRVVCNDVMIGDVYIIGGQSNAEFGVTADPTTRDYLLRLNASLASAATAPHSTSTSNTLSESPTSTSYALSVSHIRVFSVGQGTVAHVPLREFRSVETPWSRATPSMLWADGSPYGSFSAVGYAFGLRMLALQQQLQQQRGGDDATSPSSDHEFVAIGLISVNWGGTSILQWAPPSLFDAIGAPPLPSVRMRSSYVSAADPGCVTLNASNAGWLSAATAAPAAAPGGAGGGPSHQRNRKRPSLRNPGGFRRRSRRRLQVEVDPPPPRTTLLQVEVPLRSHGLQQGGRGLLSSATTSATTAAGVAAAAAVAVVSADDTAATAAAANAAAALLFHSNLWNSMVAPLTVGPISVTGVLWWQGENDHSGGFPEYYRSAFPALVCAWRGAFGSQVEVSSAPSQIEVNPAVSAAGAFRPATATATTESAAAAAATTASTSAAAVAKLRSHGGGDGAGGSILLFAFVLLEGYGRPWDSSVGIADVRAAQLEVLRSAAGAQVEVGVVTSTFGDGGERDARARGEINDDEGSTYADADDVPLMLPGVEIAGTLDTARLRLSPSAFTGPPPQLQLGSCADVHAVSALDIGDPLSPFGNVHPRDKTMIGQRLAELAHAHGAVLLQLVSRDSLKSSAFTPARGPTSTSRGGRLCHWQQMDFGDAEVSARPIQLRNGSTPLQRRKGSVGAVLPPPPPPLLRVVLTPKHRFSREPGCLSIEDVLPAEALLTSTSNQQASTVTTEGVAPATTAPTSTLTRDGAYNELVSIRSVSNGTWPPPWSIINNVRLGVPVDFIRGVEVCVRLSVNATAASHGAASKSTASAVGVSSAAASAVAGRVDVGAATTVDGASTSRLQPIVCLPATCVTTRTISAPAARAVSSKSPSSSSSSSAAAVAATAAAGAATGRATALAPTGYYYPLSKLVVDVQLPDNFNLSSAIGASANSNLVQVVEVRYAHGGWPGLILWDDWANAPIHPFRSKVEVVMTD